MSKLHFEVLDGWRALAVLGTLLCHFFDRIPEPTVYEWTRLGAHGVDLFFALSGLLMGIHWWKPFLNALPSPSQEYSRFWLKRIWRVLPAQWAYLLALWVFSTQSLLTLHPPELWASFFQFRNYLDWSPPLGAYTAHLWSLSVELHFYLLFPGLIFLMQKSKRSPYLILLSLIFGIAIWRTFSFHAGDSRVGIRTDTRLDSLLWGVFYGILYVGPQAESLKRWTQGYRVYLFFCLWLAVLWIHPRGSAFLTAAIAPLFLVGSIFSPQLLWSRILRSAPLRGLGKISYSVYLWGSFWMLQMPLSAWSIPATLITASLSYYAIERPGVQWGARILKKFSTP